MQTIKRSATYLAALLISFFENCIRFYSRWNAKCRHHRTMQIHRLRSQTRSSEHCCGWTGFEEICRLLFACVLRVRNGMRWGGMEWSEIGLGNIGYLINQNSVEDAVELRWKRADNDVKIVSSQHKIESSAVCRTLCMLLKKHPQMCCFSTSVSNLLQVPTSQL